MKSRDPLNPCELCRRALNVSDEALDRLVSHLGRAETHWLEFKAACEAPAARDASHASNHSADDYRWHLVRAVVALANTDGGCVLLGLDDSGEPVGLEHSDPEGILARKGMDAFLRHLEDAVVRRPKGWRLGSGRRIVLDGPFPEGTIEYRRGHLSGNPVVAILVKPVPPGEACLHCREELDGRAVRRFLPIRQAGQVGRVRELDDPKEMFHWQRDRDPDATDLSEVWKKLRPHDGRRGWLWTAGVATLALGLLAGVGWMSSRQPPEIGPPPPATSSLIASAQVRSVQLRFYGTEPAVSEEAVAGLAHTLVLLAPKVSSERRFSPWWDRLRRIWSDSAVSDLSPVSFGSLVFVSWAFQDTSAEEPASEDKGPAEEGRPSRFTLLVTGGDTDLRVEIEGELEPLAGLAEEVLASEIREALRNGGESLPSVN